MPYALLPDRTSSAAIPPLRLQLWIDCADKKLVLKEKGGARAGLILKLAAARR
jgi:hypothetical protein